MTRILAFVGDTYEDLELLYPKLRFEEEGWEVVVAGPQAGQLYHGKHGYPCPADTNFESVSAEDFDALLIPGGFMPDKLRRDPQVLNLVRTFDTQHKPIAMICHGGWIPISAGILGGRRATSTPGIRDDMTNAGVEWSDEPLVIDGNLISSRQPRDLPVFARAVVEALTS